MTEQQQQQAHEAIDPGRHKALSVDTVLEIILGYISQGCRLRSCSLVCTRWKAAAASATAGKGVVSATASDAFLQWLCCQGSSPQSLTVHRGTFYRNHGYNSLPNLQQLTRLELRNMTERPTLLSAVGNCMKNLVHLCLDNMYFQTHDPAGDSMLSVEACKLLAGCSRLSYLQVTRCNIDGAFMAALGRSLPQFKLLDLSTTYDYVDVSSVLSNNSNVSSSSGNSGGRLLQLQALKVHGYSLNRPDLLSGLTRLLSLSLVGMFVSEPGSLLAALPQLLHLQDLDLGGLHCPSWQPAVQLTVAELRSALTPLTQLTALGLSGTTYVFEDLAAEELQLAKQQWSGRGRRPAVGGLFPGLSLPRLQVLEVNDLCWADGRPSAHRPLCGTGELQDLIAAMPAISCLRIKGSMVRTCGSYLDLEPLSALAGSLTRLEISADEQLQDGHMQFLAGLLGLRLLTVAEVGANITDQGILGLSALSALSHLQLTGVLSTSVSMELLPGRGAGVGTEFKLHNKWDKHTRLEATVAEQLRRLSGKNAQMQQQTMLNALHAAREEAVRAQGEVVVLRGLMATLQECLDRSLARQLSLAG